MQTSERGTVSRITLIAIYTALIVGLFFYPKFRHHGTEALISWDSFGYYVYLPAEFIYHDVTKLHFMDEVIAKYQPVPSFDQGFVTDNGNYVFKYTMGQAIFYSPFFFIAHIAAPLSGMPQDGFSLIYQLMMTVGAFTYAFLALWILRSLLLHYFSDKTVAWSLLIVTLGTNYYNYVVYDGLMAHNLLFFLYVLLIWLSRKWHEAYLKKYVVLIGLTIGLMTLIRPTEIISVLIPLLWGVSFNYDGVMKRIRFYLSKYSWFLLMALAIFIGVLPQIIYWKMVSGHFLVYSYQEQGFDFLKPHLINGLFSAKKGWLVYSPVMIGAIAGFYFLLKNKRAFSLAFLSFFLLNTYIVFSWSEWWYGGSFGSRPMVPSYAILIFPLAAFVDYMRLRSYRKYLLVIMATMGIIYNLWGTRQSHGGVFHSSDMNRAFFWHGYMNPWADQKAYKYLDIAEEISDTADYHFTLIRTMDFRDEQHQIDSTYHMRGDEQYSPAVAVKPSELDGGLKQGDWIRASVHVKYHEVSGNEYDFPRLVIDMGQPGKSVKWSGLRFQKMFPDTGDWHFITFEVPVPAELGLDDPVTVYIMNNSGLPLEFDNLKIERARLKE